MDDKDLMEQMSAGEPPREVEEAASDEAPAVEAESHAAGGETGQERSPEADELGDGIGGDAPGGEAEAVGRAMPKKPAHDNDKALRRQPKDKNYVSAVVYLGEEKRCAKAFIPALCGALAARFEHYELVLVEDSSRDGTEAEVRNALAALEACPPVTMIHLSLKQGLELAMNAGLDMAVGDFVYEFDSMEMPYPPEMILQAYDTSLLGNDIVSVAPRRNRNLGATLFYRLFNSATKSRYPLRTDVFRLLSRRAVNRVHGISASMPYRKAAYAASGLKMATLEYDGEAGGKTEHLRFARAVDSLALYTDIASRASMAIAFVMLGLMVLALVYTLLVNFTDLVPEVAPGWTTTMLMLTGGFFAVFLLLAFVLKYLALLVDLIFRKQTYLVESVEKLK